MAANPDELLHLVDSDRIDMNELDLTFVDEIISEIGTSAEKVLQILQALQRHYGYLPKEELQRVCELTDITPASIVGVSSFYDQFRHRPSGRHMIRVCIGTACHVKGGQRVYDAFKRYLNIPDTEDTDADRLFTIEKVACLGCCMLAPAIQIDDVVYGHLSGEKVPTVLGDFLEQQGSIVKQSAQQLGVKPGEELGEILICLDSSCIAGGSAKVYEVLKQAVQQTHAAAVVKSVSCLGMSYLVPFVEVVLGDGRSFRYGMVEPRDGRAIVLRHFKPRPVSRKVGVLISSLLDRILTDESWKPVTRYSVDVRDGHVAEYMDRQVHVATEHCGHIDPVDLDEYLANDGFMALEKCVKELNPQEVIDQIKRNGLRGRGGAGFPTHLKWSAVRSNTAEKKYIVCNGDEGDPGAFMDRMLMESYPYRILEGMAIAAHTVGADEGFLYIRAEYPLAVRRINEAIDKCRQRGLLGNNILKSNFSLNLSVVAGAGAFVCGEETALMASIEGRRGMPRLRPPYPAERGLWDKPTLINNVETYTVVPWIIRNGAEKFSSVGTVNSKGTKVFALAGKIARGGLIEVPIIGRSSRETH